MHNLTKDDMQLNGKPSPPPAMFHGSYRTISKCILQVFLLLETDSHSKIKETS
jgi:hypothetical protein